MIRYGRLHRRRLEFTCKKGKGEREPHRMQS